MTISQEASPTYISDVHRTLQALYIPSELRKSKLIYHFGLENEREPAGALRRIIREAIRSLKPEENAPRHSNAWRLYFVLTSRFVEQLSQKEVADEMALSTRQVRRYEHEAISLLANSLWKQHPRQEPGTISRVNSDQDESVLKPPENRTQELDWLKTSYPIEVVNPLGLISEALRIVSPLVRSLKGQLQFHAADDLPPLFGQAPSMKQALLELLTGAIQASPGNQVQLIASSSEGTVRMQVLTTSGAHYSSEAINAILSKIEIARQLAALSGGSLEIQYGLEPFQVFDACLVFRAASQVTVLVIDDNADAVQLIQRFLAGTRYQLEWAKDPNQAIDRIEKRIPHIILLDVMLPGRDGWEILGQLREHPATRAVPVIVCTILQQEDLALSLGAAAFLRKPFTQAALVSILDQQAILFS